MGIKGLGIPQELKEKLFTRQIKKITTKKKGTS
jgi:hypothetical protein